MRSRHTSNKQPAYGVSLSLSLCSDLCRTLVGSVTSRSGPSRRLWSWRRLWWMRVACVLRSSRPVRWTQPPKWQVAGEGLRVRLCRRSPTVASVASRQPSQFHGLGGLLAIYVAFERLHASTLHATQCESASRRHGRPGSTGAVLLLSPTQRDDLDNARAAI